MTAGVAAFAGGSVPKPLTLAWEDPRLVYVVREPYLSRTTRVKLVAGMIAPSTSLVIESRMPTGGVIFSDGVELDALEFNSGAIATIGAAAQHARLVVA